MKVRYLGERKIEYGGRQYQPGSIIDIEDMSTINTNMFEYVPKTKANLELRKVRDLLKKVESDINDLKAYQKQYKDREDEILNDMGKLTPKTEKTSVKDIKNKVD